MENKIVIKGYKYRIYPNKEQEIQLSKTFGSCRFVYNQLLAKKIELYKNEGKSLSKTDCNNYCNRELKKEYLWLKEVDKFALTNSIYNLDSAYQNFFRRLKKGSGELGFPKFKSKRNHYYSYKTNFTNDNIKVDFENNRVQLPKLKWIKTKLHREFSGKILFATVSKTPSNKYYVSFNVECEHEIKLRSNDKVGIDLGIKDLIITSDGETFDNNKTTYKYQQKLAKLQRQFSKKKKGSSNWNKHRIKVARLHEKIANVRNDAQNKISNQIITENQIIICEDLNIKGMVKNKRLSKAIHDCGWGELTRQLKYKSEWNDKIYHEINRYFPSSQLCNKCKYQNKDTKNLGIRFWECPECGELHDRDINASINILSQGLKDLNMV
jgi:putative transposase